MCEQKWAGWDKAALDTMVYFKGRGVNLTAREARIVAALVKTNRTLSHDYLYDILWGEDPAGGPEYAGSSLKVHVYKIRRKLEKFPFGIVNIFGKGYAAVNVKSLPDFPSLSVMAYAVLIPLFLSFPVLAIAGLCQESSEMTETLKDKYGEERVSIALTNTGKLLERYENPTDGSWTMIVYPDGTYACVFATGTDWYDKKVFNDPGA